jgi:putative copper export protein
MRYGEPDMKFTPSALLFAFGLFLAMLLLLEIGRRIALRRRMKEGDSAADSFGAVGGSVFALLGLLIAFTFSGAASRFDDRRYPSVDESNAIGTAYLRLDLLPAETQPALKENFRRYLDARLEAYRRALSVEVETALEGLVTANRLQSEIWLQAVAACREANSTATTNLLLSALNEMFDIATTRTLAIQMHPPMIIFVMLVGMALAASLLAGHGMVDSGSWVHKLVFAATLAAAVYVIVDLEYPRLGLIRVDYFDQALIDLRKNMK